jgi:hypothetical protein
LSGGGVKPVWEPTPAVPRAMAGLSNSASAGASGCMSGRAALARVGRAGSFAFFGGRVESSDDFAMGTIWACGGGKESRSQPEHMRDNTAGASSALQPEGVPSTDAGAGTALTGS